jgi:kynurenine formamidase
VRPAEIPAFVVPESVRCLITRRPVRAIRIGPSSISVLPRYPATRERISTVPFIATKRAMISARSSGAVDVPLRDDVHGKALLVRTGWDANWGQDRYWSEGPYLSPQAIQQIVEARPALVGVDFSNVDNTDDPARPAHTLLLRSGILIVEHLCNLGAIPDRGAFFYAVPLRLKGGASFPVRAFAEIRA